MHIVKNQSTLLDPEKIKQPEHHGEVAWSQFNEHYQWLQHCKWFHINKSTQAGFARRLYRLLLAFVAKKQDAFRDLRGKSKAFLKMPIPENPNIVFFGAEVGWEAHIIQALFGDKGKVLLIDNDPGAFERFQTAPKEVEIKAPRGFPSDRLVIKRSLSNVEYLQEDLFQVTPPMKFDLGIDWGLIEHFRDSEKSKLQKKMQSYLKEGGLQLSAVPRNTTGMRTFYWAFQEELNFGYRELMNMAEFNKLVKAGGFTPIKQIKMPTTCLILSKFHKA